MDFACRVGCLARIATNAWCTYANWVDEGGADMGRVVEEDEILMITFVHNDGFFELVGTKHSRAVVIPASKLIFV